MQIYHLHLYQLSVSPTVLCLNSYLHLAVLCSHYNDYFSCYLLKLIVTSAASLPVFHISTSRQALLYPTFIICAVHSSLLLTCNAYLCCTLLKVEKDKLPES